MQTSYRLMRGSDDQLWVTIKPLMNDIQQALADLAEMDISTLNKEDTYIFNMKILGLKTVYEFIGALETEQFLKEKRADPNSFTGVIPINKVLR